MPLYSYQCETCGPFGDWQTMAQSDRAACCPSCEARSPRLLAAPFLSAVSAPNRIAHERNERAAETPRVMRRGELDRQGPPIHTHAPRRGRNMYRPSMQGHAH